MDWTFKIILILYWLKLTIFKAFILDKANGWNSKIYWRKRKQEIRIIIIIILVSITLIKSLRLWSRRGK
jgi:hypothetical protein